MNYLDDLIFLDLETTGLDKNRDEIIEIGAIRIKNGEEVDLFHRLVNPLKKKLSPLIFELCRGIKKEDLQASPTFR